MMLRLVVISAFPAAATPNPSTERLGVVTCAATIHMAGVLRLGGARSTAERVWVCRRVGGCRVLLPVLGLGLSVLRLGLSVL